MRPVLLYDGNCGFCLRWVRRLRHLDPEGRIEVLPASLLHTRSELPAIAPEALDRSMHLVLPGGEVKIEGDALRGLLLLLPGWNTVGYLLGFPGIRELVDRGYRWVAERRHRLGCGPEGCGWEAGSTRKD